MNEQEIKAKLEKLEKYEAKERRKKRWKPYLMLEAEIAEMYDYQHRLEDAAIHQQDADEISREYRLGLEAYGGACIQNALDEFNKMLEIKEQESERLHDALMEEEE